MTPSGRVTTAGLFLFVRTGTSGCRGMLMLLQKHENEKDLSLESGRWFFFLNFLRQLLYYCCFSNVTFFTLKVFPLLF